MCLNIICQLDLNLMWAFHFLRCPFYFLQCPIVRRAAGRCLAPVLLQYSRRNNIGGVSRHKTIDERIHLQERLIIRAPFGSTVGEKGAYLLNEFALTKPISSSLSNGCARIKYGGRITVISLRNDVTLHIGIYRYDTRTPENMNL